MHRHIMRIICHLCCVNAKSLSISVLCLIVIMAAVGVHALVGGSFKLEALLWINEKKNMVGDQEADEPKDMTN